MRAAALLLLVALLGAGCGSSGFHSATHVYTVHQVQAAFAAHGIKLRKLSRHPPRAVALDGKFGRQSDFWVAVYVTATRRLANPFRLFPQAAESRGPITDRNHGNVLLVYRFGTPTQQIQAALADLH